MFFFPCLHGNCLHLSCNLPDQFGLIYFVKLSVGGEIHITRNTHLNRLQLAKQDSQS